MNSSDSKAREAFYRWWITGAGIRAADETGWHGAAEAAWTAALQWAASQQAAEGDLRRDADRWRQLAYMESRMVAPQVMRDYIARPEWLDKASALRAQYGDVASTQGGADEPA